MHDLPETEEADAIDAVLRGGFRWLRFPPALESRFQIYDFARNRRKSVVCVLVGLVVFDMLIISDVAVIADIWHFAAILRLAVVTPTALLTSAVTYWLVPPRYRRQAMLVNLVFNYFLVAGCLILFQIKTASPHAQFYLGGMPLVVTFFVMRAGADFWVMAAATLIVLAMTLVGLRLAPLLTDVMQLEVGLILCGIVILAIMFSYSAGHAMRLNYLLARRQGLSALREQKLAEALERANAELRLLTLTDPLTGIANRRHFNDELTQLWGRPAEKGGTISLVLMDIDFFKRYNDHYGHVAGDEALRAVAQIVGGEFRGRHDLVARYGGEEFGVVLADCDLLDAQTVARRLCTAVEEFAIPHEARPDGMDCVTISVGVASFQPGAGGDPADLITAADMALYRAKALGRNCVMVQSSAAMSG
jgi:diguanylate cyclase (GGDEF)-like protein